MHNKKWLLLAAVCLVGIVVSTLFLIHHKQMPPFLDKQLVTPLFDKASKHLSPDLAGYGFDPNYQDMPRYYPMAYACYASAQAIHAKKTGSSASRRNAEIAARWLVKNRDLNEDSIMGWGLPFSWDAFGDGSTNPKHTVYGITTALAIYALLDVYDLTKEKEFLDTALAALGGYWAHFTILSDGTGYFWYSEQVSDAQPVPNVSAMLAGAYAKAGAISGREDFKEIALAAAHYVIKRALEGPHGTFWPYIVGKTKPNPDCHAPYVVVGLSNVKRFAGLKYDLSDAYKYLQAFIKPGMVTAFVETDSPARVWGPGYLMYALCANGQRDVAQKILPILKTYEYSPGLYGLYPGDKVMFPRFQTHVLLGLAECGF